MWLSRSFSSSPAGSMNEQKGHPTPTTRGSSRHLLQQLQILQRIAIDNQHIRAGTGHRLAELPFPLEDLQRLVAGQGVGAVSPPRPGRLAAAVGPPRAGAA